MLSKSNRSLETTTTAIVHERRPYTKRIVSALVTMKLSHAAVLAALSASPVAGKVYFKEQFNDEVSKSQTAIGAEIYCEVIDCSALLSRSN
jgi:hypothetical protein